MVLYVGLGNPGPAYEKTRHNIGFRVIDTLVNRTKASLQSSRNFRGHLYKSGEKLFLKPSTYMNNSGQSVQKTAAFYKIALQSIIVIHDDIDLPFGSIRYKRGGGDGGHNGLRSIDAFLGREYTRVRIGVGKPDHKNEVAQYVLSNFESKEEDALPDIIDIAAEAALLIPDTSLDLIKSRYTYSLAE